MRLVGGAASVEFPDGGHRSQERRSRGSTTISDSQAKVGSTGMGFDAPGNESLCADVMGRSTHTLPRLGLDTVCIDDQESEIAESVTAAVRVVICWPEVVHEELIYLLHGAVEEWHG